MLPSSRTPVASPPAVRCAIYTRKSTEEGLSQEFNSLDAQREAAEAYIQSQREQGWTALPQHYDDGGFTGATLERPALKQLLRDIQAGQIDCVVIYKVDRLSRSLFDFARLMHTFEGGGVSFVSVTQQFNSSTPMGKLTLNILMSFAEFERQIISERTRDKVSAARKKGKWMGGFPVLGYDSDANSSRLVINETEAEQVRQMFATFVQGGSLTTALEEIHNRGWRMKNWATQHGKNRGGQPFDRPALIRLLTNPLYIGQVTHKGKLYPGEQAAIVDRKLWRKANDLLALRECRDASPTRNCQGAILRQMLVCAACGKRMVPGYTTKKGRRYPYYVCLTAQKRGAKACPGKLVPARQIERAVVEALYGLRSAERGPALVRGALPLDRQIWDELDRQSQHESLLGIIEQISYDRRLRQGTMRLRQDALGSAGAEIRVWAQKPALVQKIPPAAFENMGMQSLEQTPERLPRITRLLALAVRYEELLGEGMVKDYADLSRLGGVSRPRITQLMNLRNLAPVLQERILLPGDGDEINNLNERTLRSIAGTPDWRKQIMAFEKLFRRKVAIPIK